MLDQDNNFYADQFEYLITCLLYNVQILKGEVTCWSPLGVKGFSGKFLTNYAESN